MRKTFLPAVLIALLLFCVSTASSFAETGVKTQMTPDGGVCVTTYSTEKQDEASVYRLFIVKKQDGRWVRKTYLRDIEVPKAKEPFGGKHFKFKSKKTEKIEWMQKNTIYRLYPADTDDRRSVPFWKNPLG